MADCVGALKGWAGKERATVVYDSTVDEFTGGVFYDNVTDRENIAVVGVTTDGDVVGMFYSRAVDKQEDFFDRGIFAFSFESHGRCMTPQRFVLKEGWKKGTFVNLYKNNNSGFINFLNIYGPSFWLGNEKSNSYCWTLSRAYEGLEDTTLTGSNGGDYDEGGHYHHYTRLIAVQFE